MNRQFALKLLSNVAVFCALPPFLAAVGAGVISNWLELPGWANMVLCAVFASVLATAGTYLLWGGRSAGSRPLALRWLYYLTAFFALPALLAALGAGLVSNWLGLPGWAGLSLYAVFAGVFAVGLYLLLVRLGWSLGHALYVGKGRF